MATGPVDLAQIRFDNAMALFDEFVRATVKHADASTLRGLEARFAAQLLIQPSYWSQIKARSRQIGERLARQFEQRSKKPAGWLDALHDTPDARQAGAEPPRDDDERFIVELVLSYYRRHPERARARLLELLEEAMQPAAGPPLVTTHPAPKSDSGNDDALWTRTRAAVAPLKRKR